MITTKNLAIQRRSVDSRNFVSSSRRVSYYHALSNNRLAGLAISTTRRRVLHDKTRERIAQAVVMLATQWERDPADLGLAERIKVSLGVDRTPRERMAYLSVSNVLKRLG